MQRQSQLYRQPPSTGISQPPAPAALPLVDGRFELKKKLGEGGMGEVYLARDLASSRDVALKRLAGWMLDSGWKAEDAAALFSNEAEALLRISHRCVVGLVAAPFPPSYIVMEYVRGLGLDRIGMLPEDVLRLSLDLCDALYAIHTVGVIHRDIKPENILVSFKGERMNIKLIDFGTARMRGRRARDPFVCTPVGTAQFMSPEALEAGGRADERSDIFSLGALMYDKLAGVPPFAAGAEGDFKKALEIRKAETYVPLKETAPDLPGAVCEVVDKAMAHLPMERHRSAYDFKNAILKAMACMGMS